MEKRKAMNFGVSMNLLEGKSPEYAEKYLAGLTKDDLAKLAVVWIEIFDKFIEVVKEAGFEVIEIVAITLPLAEFRIPSFLIDELRKRISKFKEVSYHLPAGEIQISGLYKGIRKKSVEETKKHIDLCQELKIRKVVMHPGCFSSMPKIYSLMGNITKEGAKESILEIYDHCQKNGIKLTLENLPGSEPLFQKPEEFEPFIKEDIGLTLDTLHALTSGIDPLLFIEKFKKQISIVHFNDGYREELDIHYPLGSGEVDCIAVLEELKKINFEGPIILEVWSEEDLAKSREFLKKNGYF